MFLTDFNDNNKQKVVLALGYFDCLHIGHKRLVLTAKLIAEKAGVLSGVFTFSNNPGNLLKKKNKLVNTFEERLVILEKLGGGGHITLAGAQLDDSTLEEAKALLIEKINEYFDETVS